MVAPQPVPVILDTDIGSDIDDTWALALLLCSPELDLKLVTTATSQPAERAKIVCRVLEAGGRSDVPVGVGLPIVNQDIRHGEWVTDYDLCSYAGGVREDGVGAMIETIMNSPSPVTLICIGPLPNVAEALRREPRIAARTHFVGMHGSVFRGYNGAAEPAKEWNVVSDPASCARVFEAAWASVTLTPLDTCGLVRLGGAKYAAIRASRRPLARAIVENYDLWRHGGDDEGASSILFDTVAVYLAFARDLVTMQRIGLRVTDDGFTRPDATARPMDVAVDWKHLDAFENWLVERLA